MKDLTHISSNTHDTHPFAKGIVYDASLSTMWAKNNFPVFTDFFEAATRLGFSKVELNHQINSKMLSGVDLSKYVIGSIHEPCPADISVETLKLRDWLISSPDENCRQQGVTAVKRSLDLAKELSAQTIVIHCGHISPDMKLENKLRNLYSTNMVNSGEYKETMALMVNKRRDLIAPCMEAVEKSLKELLQYAGQYGIRLGLENRYHYFDIPSQDEMAQLLELANPDQLGFIYDTGHAQAMGNMGFYPQKAWLDRFSIRILGTHLHDVIGITDHYAPGLGEVDFEQLSGYLPKGSYRTMEVQPNNTFEQIRTGLKILADSGCIQPL